MQDLVTTDTAEAKINGSYSVTEVTPKPLESHQQAAAANSTARCHVRTNSHHHVEGVLTAVTHRARKDGRCTYPHMLICANKMVSSSPSSFDMIFDITTMRDEGRNDDNH